MAQPFDPYRALGVRRDATEAEVKAAHRKLAKRFHPDADGGDRDRFLRVQEAYKVLSDALLRREWDAKHAPGPMRGGASPTPTLRPERELRDDRSGRRSRSIPSLRSPPGRRQRMSHRPAGHAAHVPTRGPRPRCRGGKRV